MPAIANDYLRDDGYGRRRLKLGPLIGVTVVAAGLGVIALYNICKIEVGTGQQAVLIRRSGLDLKPDMELAPLPEGGLFYKGVQTGGPNNGVLTEGRYFYNPYYWDWEFSPQFLVPTGKMGVRVSLSGDDLPLGHVIAEVGEKGILKEVLRPGRYPYNPYAEKIQLYDPVMIPAGFRGVVTLLAGVEPTDPNVVLVKDGQRGVQKTTLDPGTYYLNPFVTRVSLVNCKSQRFNLSQPDVEMDFLSADGFSVVVDGAIEFRVIPDRASEVFVLYNEDDNGDDIEKEVITKIITPESRSICRIGGSKLTGGQFINGEDREQFQRNFEKSLTENCKKQGIDILSVAVTSIQPPEEIATPVRAREVAKQKLIQYNQEKLQQLSEAQLKVQVLLAGQKKAMVEAEQSVVELTTRAEQDQQVAVTLAEQKYTVSQTHLDASKNKAAAIVAKAEADAEVITFNNKASLSGLAARVKAFDGDGSAMAQNMLISKLAPSFRTIMSNSDGPLMDLFGQFVKPGTNLNPPRTARATVPPAPEANELPTNPFTPTTTEPKP